MLVLGPPQKNEKGNIVINMNLDAPKDEGDFGMYELLLGTLGALDDKDKKDEKPKTEAEQFIDSLSSTIGFLSEDKGLKKTFIGKQYIPFLAALKAAGHLETLAYVVRWQSGTADKQTMAWIEAHKADIIKMNDWSKKYRP